MVLIVRFDDRDDDDSDGFDLTCRSGHLDLYWSLIIVGGRDRDQCGQRQPRRGWLRMIRC